MLNKYTSKTWDRIQNKEKALDEKYFIDNTV